MAWAPDWAEVGPSWPNSAFSRFVSAGGIRWHVQMMGAGPVVVLLHGTGGASHSFADLAPLLAERAQVVVPDLPGHGFSGAASGRHSLPGMARAVAALFASLDIKPDVIVGHSAGAAVALRLVLDGMAAQQVVGLNAALTPFRGLAALLFPTMARALSLNPLTPTLAARSLSDPNTVNRLLRGTGSIVPNHIAAHYRTLVASPAHVDGALRMMARWELEPLERELPNVPVPVTLIYGEEDRAVPPKDTRWAALKLPKHDDISLPGLGHLMHEEAPEILTPLILSRLHH